MRIALVFITITLIACAKPDPKIPSSPAILIPVPVDWDASFASRDAAKQEYLRQHSSAYQWFANFSFSETDGTPFILFKLLTKLAPELWGSGDNFLSEVGLFIDERQPDFPAPLGIGFSGLSRTENNVIDYSSITCGACHIGRVQMPDGSYNYLEGAVNTRFNLPLLRGRVTQTFEQVLGQSVTEATPAAISRLTNQVLATLDEVHASDPNYFYGNFRFGQRQFDADYEAVQVALFKAQANALITTYLQRLANEKIGYEALVNKNYASIKPAMLQGIPGMADATAMMASNAYAQLKAKPVLGWFAPLILPGAQGITDIMSVWEQDKRKASWSDDHKELINGGGQWNGSVPIPVYRNIAAELTLGLENTDIRVGAFADELLQGLPANPYPFNVDVELANIGKVLFADNCADCHRPHNGKVYDNLGTPMGRANILNWLTARAGASSFYAACSENTTVVMEGQAYKPCAEFENVPLTGKRKLIMRPVSEQRGYNARPLSGIWAQAPYFHNGSVPTLYHVLIATERPRTFLRGIEEYDQEKLGFVWQADAVQYRENLTNAMRFDTEAIPAFDASGHSGVISENGSVYKLDWSDDRSSALAIMEYLKIL
jgi:mono/diheme cytochrome c family protein